MTETVNKGYSPARSFDHRCFRRSTSAQAHQSAQQQWTLGIAAYEGEMGDAARREDLELRREEFLGGTSAAAKR